MPMRAATDPDTIKATAGPDGLLYLLSALAGIVGAFALPSFVVDGDAAATVRNILAGQQTYRLGLFASFVWLVPFIFVPDGRIARPGAYHVAIHVSPLS